MEVDPQPGDFSRLSIHPLRFLKIVGVVGDADNQPGWVFSPSVGEGPEDRAALAGHLAGS
jgi:hypothetical protein